MKKSNKRCAFFTFGCKVNQYETQLIREELINQGFVETDDHPAFYIINACTVTSRADKKCEQLIKSLHKNSPQAQIILTGCYAKNHPFVSEKLPEISCVIPQEKKILIPEIILSKIKPDNLSSLADSANVDTRFYQSQVKDFSQHSRAFVKIQDGCRNFCSYCIVPFMRPKVVSKTPEKIIQEVDQLSKRGFNEIVLSGINLGRWGEDLKQKHSLSLLVKELNELQHLGRLRLSSIELMDVSTSLIRRLADCEKLCPHLHIPLQSGDNRILEKMNRPYTQQEYLKKIQKIRKTHKNIAFTTDVIVGFPGESDKQFKNTLKTVKDAGFIRVHVFPFSPRPGTPAAEFPDKVDQQIIRERKFILSEVASQTSFLERKQMLDQDVSVLFEVNEAGIWGGYSDTYVYVKAASSRNLKNSFVDVRIVDVTLSHTKGKV